MCFYSGDCFSIIPEKTAGKTAPGAKARIAWGKF